MASNGGVYLSGNYVQDNGAISQTAPPAGVGFGTPGTSGHSSSQYSDTPRRTHNLARQPEELHISSDGSAVNSQSSIHIPRHHSYHVSQDAASAPGISVHQATPQGAHHTSAVNAGTLPGALRPGVSSANTAPGTVPTLPQITTQTQQYASSSRSSTASHSHSYSRSSPGGFDQKYLPYNSTPESSKYPTTPNHRYGSSHTPHGSSAYSPLGLSDIRPDSSMADGPTSANPYSGDANSSFATNSNYMAPWPVYAFDWCKWPLPSQNSGDAAGKMAIGSFVEDGHNFIQILDTHVTLEENDMSDEGPQFGLGFVKTAEATHSYPVTRILWEPASSQKQSTDLLATSGDHLRLWSLPSQPAYNHSNSISRSSTGSQLAPQKLTPLALLSNSKSPEHTAPLTSLDWNTVSPSLIITSSIDTTCTIWDIPTLTAKTQLIAHDKEVFDVRFCANSVDVFVSCGADGSVRMFDLRSLEHSTIIYEPSEKNDKCMALLPFIHANAEHELTNTSSIQQPRQPLSHGSPTNNVLRPSPPPPRRLPSRRPPPRNLLPRQQQHSHPRRAATRSSSPRTQRPQRSHQLYRMVTFEKRNISLRWRRLAGSDLGSAEPREFGHGEWGAWTTNHERCDTEREIADCELDV